MEKSYTLSQIFKNYKLRAEEHFGYVKTETHYDNVKQRLYDDFVTLENVLGLTHKEVCTLRKIWQAECNIGKEKLMRQQYKQYIRYCVMNNIKIEELEDNNNYWKNKYYAENAELKKLKEDYNSLEADWDEESQYR